MLDFTFKAAAKQQEKGLELTLVSGWVPQVQAETPTLSSILKSAFLPSKLFRAPEETGFIYIHVPT